MLLSSRGLAGEAAGLARESDERVRAVSERSKALEGAIGGFLEELGRARAERYRVGGDQQG